MSFASQKYIILHREISVENVLWIIFVQEEGFEK